MYLVKSAPEPPLPFGAIVPLLVDNSECNIFIRRASHESNEASIFLAGWGKRLPPLPSVLSLDTVRRSLGFINEIRVEDIKFITLDDLGRRIVMVVMGLIVLVPLVAHLHSIEIPGLARPVFVGPLRA